MIANCLASSASFINATGGFNGDTPTEISVADVSRVTSALRHANGETFTRMLPGEDKFGSAPVRNAFVCLTNDLVGQNLDGLAGFTHVSQYPSQEDILESEYGSILNLRFFMSSIGSTIPSSSLLGRDVYNMSCVAREAYTVIDQDGYSSQFIYNDPSIAGGPLRLNASIGWKMATVPRITNDFWCINLRVTIRS